ncbi:hypothetical protein BU24DRAFT_459735 [Aaosphaeria arxii CBS 175.79]|uniref:Uncharacterized protein n=1 Tax=Aaosphaeria arxii CBS 175.79 TaxID=1450172 RepID=A0A6A5Y3K2_9PLEO|nr:uncharacterized protein BU24DRAFT_459735 [Aaosphaeria arxii CBS 175.79]KAF2020125.1 hypothetical protein BU24DRAFT_459735 [Aaosphaeria arxii CBS 175.79]
MSCSGLQSCLPFLLANPSAPLTLHTDAADTANLNLKTKTQHQPAQQRHEPFVNIQPARTAAPMTYKRFSAYERRMQLKAEQELLAAILTPAQPRQTQSTWSSSSAPPVIEQHDTWIGTKKAEVKEKEKERAKRISSPSELNTSTFREVEWTEKVAPVSSSPPLSAASTPNVRHSPSMMSLHSSVGSPQESIFSTSSTNSSVEALSLMSPPIESTPAHFKPVDKSEPSKEPIDNAPFLPNLHFSSYFEGLGIWMGPSSPACTSPPLDSPVESVASSANEEVPEIINFYASEIPRSSYRQQTKKVSFATSSPEIISEESGDISLAVNHLAGWTNLSTGEPITRSTSQQSLRTQAAGRSILRQKSSFTNDAPAVPEKDTPSRQFRTITMYGAPTSQPGSNNSAVSSSKEPEFERFFRVAESPSLSPVPSLSSARSSSPSSSRSESPAFSPPANAFFPISLGDVVQKKASLTSYPYGPTDFSDDSPTIREFEETRAIIMSRPTATPCTKSNGQQRVVINAAPPSKPARTLSLPQQQKQVRHWSMSGAGWTKTSGGSPPVKNESAVPPVPRMSINYSGVAF